jgi:adenylate cyclase
MSPEEFKRRLAAILSADVEGYSRLMREDEEATIRTLKSYRTATINFVQRYRGRVVDSPGDNVLAEFTSVVDAVNCAVEIQRELAERNAELPDDRKMQFRIGVNLDDIVEDGERIYGDGVNIAARIESLAEGGGICISGTVYDSIKTKLCLEFEYLGEHEVKNIDKPIRIFRVLSFPRAVTDRSFKPASVERMEFPLPDKPSIAVLPLTNMSGDPEQEYIGDGLSENIISALSQISEMFVIAHNSTFTYKGKPVKVQQVAEELGVQYVLEGSVQKSGDRLRVTAQLIDALTGHHLWSEIYNRKMKDLFELQDEITKKIAVSLQVEMTSGEQARLYAKSTDNLEAWSTLVKGYNLYQKVKKTDIYKARELFEAAIKLDPGYVSAWTLLAGTYWTEVIMQWSQSPAGSLKSAYEAIQKALALDDRNAHAHANLGMIYLNQRQHDKAIAEGQKTIALDPNYSIGHHHFAVSMFYCGRFEESIELLRKAMRLNPFYPPFYLYTLSRGYLYLGRYEEAIEPANQMVERSRKGECSPWMGLPQLAVAYKELGRDEEARDIAAKLLKIRPGHFELAKKEPWKSPELLERELELFKRAGLQGKEPLPLPD